MVNQEKWAILLDRLLFAAQKAKSDVLESLGDLDEKVALRVLYETNLVYDENGINLIGALMKYANKAEKGILEPIDIYNALLISRMTPLMGMMYGIMYHGAPLPDPKDSMLEMMSNG